MSEREQEQDRTDLGEDLDNPLPFTCKYCGQTFRTMPELGAHSRKCSKRKEARASTAKQTTPQEPQSPYKTETDPNAILEEILSTHPDITDRIKGEVMDWAQRKGSLQPMELQAILMSMRGMTQATVGIIASKYSFALNKAQQEGKINLPPTFWTQQPQGPSSAFIPYMQPQPYMQSQQREYPNPYGYPTGYPPGYQPQPQPGYWQQPQPLTEDRIRSIFRDESERSRPRTEPKEPEPYMDIEEPVRDPEGKIIIGPDEQPIMKKMRVPVSQATRFAPSGEDSEMKTLAKMKMYKDIFGEKGPDENKIREIIRSETPKPKEEKTEKPITIEDVKAASTEAANIVAQSIHDQQEKDKKEDERFQKLENAVREAGGAKTIEGYREDGYRLLGQGAQEVALALKERRPVEVIIREGLPLLTGTPPSIQKKAEEGVAGGATLIDRLGKRGWVVET